MPAPHRPEATRIVLLSDGTGNSSAKLMKTNVWRIYEAADLTTGDQIACYDNGVGTSSFKPLAVLGGALGWGLKRNVRHLYTYACTHYKGEADGRPADVLYGFGFSRGAFTMRVLMGLIESQGLITGLRGRELERLAKWAYREYRREFNPTRGLVTPLRVLRDLALRAWEALRRRTPYAQATRVVPKVAFLGLWDTVDAYGLPIDEMTRGWDQWVWPLSMRQNTCPSNVTKFCHAVALDDERHTFHPVLLDEGKAAPSTHIDQERVTQVWFAGVHSNVGGGYPDDALAHVSLRWMAAEAEKQGLRLHSQVTALWAARADPNGPANDSRRGLGSYYRYNPRSIQKLTADRFADVTIRIPKIHQSVFARIASGRDDYAPIVLPERYAIVQESGAIVHHGDNRYEHPTQSSARCADQERVWNLVWLRRVLYFSTVGLTAVIVLAPFLFKEGLPGEINPASGSIAGLVNLLGAFLPGMLQPIASYWESQPVVFAVVATALALLFVASTIVQRAIGDGMRSLWDGILRHGPREVGPPSPPTDLIYRIRSHRWYRGGSQILSEHVFPFIFGIAALAAVALIVVGTLNRAVFSAGSALGYTCKEPEPRQPSAAGLWTGIPFDSKSLCEPTGVRLEAGESYDVTIALPPDWKDKDYAAGLDGVATSTNPWVYIPALPFRRVLREPWFVPMVRIGRHSPEYHRLTQATTRITPRRTADLYVFVNDAVGLPGFREFFYENNQGVALLSVRKLPAKPATAGPGPAAPGPPSAP
jgi:uncharacterized protein (DUF2235 family)